jgi:hypothetical protein
MPPVVAPGNRRPSPGPGLRLLPPAARSPTPAACRPVLGTGTQASICCGFSATTGSLSRSIQHKPFWTRRQAGAHGVFDHAGPCQPCLNGCFGVAPPLTGRGRRPVPYVIFEAQCPGSQLPLSTLRLRPYGRTRMTRGRSGWLRLPRMRLPLTTSYRSPGAPSHHNFSYLLTLARLAEELIGPILPSGAVFVRSQSFGIKPVLKDACTGVQEASSLYSRHPHLSAPG